MRGRRLRGDIIELYMHLHGIYDSKSSLSIKLREYIRIRGHGLTIAQSQVKYDTRKYFFVNRVQCIWNSLPESVVTAQSLNAFKNRLDRFWIGQDMIYNWEEAPTGAGSRSQVSR